MTRFDPIAFSFLTQLPPVDAARAERLLAETVPEHPPKIVVLDDDPTGVQTVHNVSVFTDWKPETILAAFREESPMFFILTNSRAMTARQTERAHREMARGIVAASKETGKDFVLISRSDSTMRGHYPLETETLRKEIYALTGFDFDGEIVFPFFAEGGRYTIGNVHYVKEGERLTPAGMTEFAQDKTFGYKASHLGEWCEEKTGGEYRASDMLYILLESLRAFELDAIAEKLCGVTDFQKVICNAADYADVKVFAAAYWKAIKMGKRFLFRSAAAVTKVLGRVPDKPLLTRKDLIAPDVSNGGIIVVGSHVNKTTRQLEVLRECGGRIEFIEFNQHRVLEEGGLTDEAERVSRKASGLIASGVTVAVYTRRDRFDLDTDSKERQLEISVQISDAITGCIANLSAKPSFIIAKGGITSSDIGTKALRVKKATVMGQAAPGVPVWMTGAESRFPGMPYIIFPGNVGDDTTLRGIVEALL